MKLEIAMAVGRPGQALVDLALRINDRHPRNYVTAILLHMALPFLNLRNWMLGIKTGK